MGNFNSIPADDLNELTLVDKEISEEYFKLNYQLISSIDCGSFGQVLKYSYENQFYAVKEIRCDETGPAKMEEIKNEILILQYVNNLEPKLPFFVKYYGFSVFSCQKIALIYELADGNLIDLVTKKFYGLEPHRLFSEYLKILLTLVKALTFLEIHNISHRDLKPQNVLFKVVEKSFKNLEFSYILCDFGISKLCDLGSQNYNTTAGSPIFMSPEVTFNYYNQKQKSYLNPFKSDVYSLGLLLLKIILNKNLSSVERMIEKDFDPNDLDAGPNDMKINSMIEESYEYFLKLSDEKYKINKFKIILRHMLMYNTKRRPDIFGIYAFLISMGFIKDYGEIEEWISFRQNKHSAKQLASLQKQNEELKRENEKLKMENEKIKNVLKENPTRPEKSISVKQFKSEKNFSTMQLSTRSLISSPDSTHGTHKKSNETLTPAEDFKIENYTGKIVNIGKYLMFPQIKIGKGSFGDVFLGSDLEKKNLFAIKERKDNNKFAHTKEKFFELLNREVNNAKLLTNHPNIVNFVDVVQNDEEVYIICEYCPEGSLSYVLQKNGGKLEEQQVKLILKQIINGFKLLHENNIIHRNLKPSSILLYKGVAKITGFYFSKHVLNAEKKQLMTSFGTPQYLAPEIFETKEYSSKCDIWSLGITLYEILYGEFPWRGKTTQDLIENNIKKKPLVFPEVPTVSQKMKDLISMMLLYDQEKRISWNELFQFEI